MARQQPGSGLRDSRASRTPLSLVEPASFPPPVLDLTVVVPYYNPGPVLRSTVERAVEVLSETGISFEIVTVSDGSTDGSDASLEGLPSDLVVQVVLPHAGKGKAVRAGLARGRGRYLGFIDGDGDVPPELLAEFVRWSASGTPTWSSGASATPTPRSSIRWPGACTRGDTSNWSAVLFHLDVRDTQAGIKLVRREVLAEVLPLMVEEGYAFDLEMLVIARRLGHRDLVEAPVRIGIRFSSTVSRRVVVEMLRDTFAIWWRLRSGDAYGAKRRA